MKISVNQRCVLLVILAMIFVLTLLMGLNQSNGVEELSSTKLQFSDTQPVAIIPATKQKLDTAIDKVVLINSASAEEIAQELDGIGQAIAKRIVTRRQTQGHFENFEQLKAVSGVGIAKIEVNRQRISFD
ncbi:MAG: ComEA family DNA-binding protein [Porticoccaceae bacterium]